MVDSVAYHKFMSILSMSSIPFMFTIYGDFVFDDSEAVVKNPDVTSDSWSNAFAHDFWGTNITSNLSHKSYRPLTVLSYRLNYLLNYRHLSATQFKATNLVCHSLCCVIIWQTLERVLTRVKFKPRTVYSIDIAYSSALLFGAHPIHTEVICAVVGRADVLAAVTFFLSFFLYEKAMDNTKLRYHYVIATIFFAGCSMLFKENGITVLGFCVLYELIVKLKINRRGNVHICKKSVIKIVTIIIAAALLLYSRWKVMGGTKPVFKPTDNPAAFSDDYFVKVATYSYLYFLNLLLLMWPQWLCYDWSMGCVPLIRSIQDYRIFCVLFMYGFGMLFIVCIFIANKRKPTRRVLLIATSLIVVPFLPASNIFYPVGFVIAERIMYISSAGYCLILCICLNKMIQVDKARVVSLLLFCMVLILYAGKTWQRSKAFQNEYKLFTSGLAVCPLNAKIHYNVAKVADAKNMTTWAMHEYREAIRLYPEYYQAMNNLANMLKNEKKFDKAEVLLKSAIKHKKDFPAAWMNLGIVYANTKRYDDALSAYKNALSYRSNYPDCHYNIGNLYLEMNKSEDAMKYWYKAINLKPNHVPAWVNLISLLDNTGQRDKVLQLMSNALNELPESASINFVVANVYGKMDRYEEAEKYFLNAISLFGNRVQSVHYFNLGVLYHRWKKYALAEEMYKKALQMDPHSPNIVKNLNKIQKLINKV